MTRRLPFFLLPLAFCLLAHRASAQAIVTTPDDAVVLIRTLNSLCSTRGSGFIVGDGSWVVTASHVISVDIGKGKRAADQTVLVYVPWTGRPYEAKVAAVDGVADIALLKLPQAGFPAIPLDGLDLKDADAALAALKDRPIRLYGFPLTYGEGTVASLAKPEHNDGRLREIAKKGETNLCVLTPCPDVQAGWSGGPVVDAQKGAAIGVFHSLYQPKETPNQGYPAGTINGYLADLFRAAGIQDVSAFTRVNPPTVAYPADAAERMARQMRGLSWSAIGKWKEAEEEQRAILKTTPDDALAHVELGRVLLQEQKDEEALKEMQEAVRLAPHSMWTNLYLGRAQHRNFDPRAAAAALKSAMEASPREVEPQLVLAEVQEENQKLADAEATLRAVVQSVPEHPVALFRLGNLLEKAGKTEEGTKLLQQASALAANDASLSFIPLNYARALDIARKYREAEAIYRQVIRTDPDNATAYFFLSQLYLKTNQPEDAQIQLNAAFRLPHLSDEMVEAFRALQEKINKAAGAAN